MRAYLDASVLVSLFVRDALTARADAWLRRARPAVIVSDFAAAELASALARRVRTRALRAEEAQAAFVAFDAWTTQQAERARTISADVAAAEAWLRRLDLTLRTPDALNLAIARRCGAALATFDAKMAAAAGAVGVELAEV